MRKDYNWLMQNGDAPATKKDIEQLTALIEKTETGMKALIEKTETTLLTEFWKWARLNDIKVRSVASRTADFDERFSLLEERVADLEHRRHP